MISPVIAMSWRTGRLSMQRSQGREHGHPGAGAVLGNRARGNVNVNVAFGQPAWGRSPVLRRRLRIRLNAAVADSFITSPIWPVRVMLPLARACAWLR